jgi:hypothetical protein
MMSSELDNPLIQSALFYPRSARPGTSRLKNVTDGTLPVAGEVALGYRLYAHQPGQPVIVYFHGNGEIAPDHDEFAPLYRVAGASLLVVDYRGYGWSTGVPSLAALIPDVEAVYRALPDILGQAHIADGPLVVMGRSLGSAYAIHFAHTYSASLRGLIVESGFTGIASLLTGLRLPTLLPPGAHDPMGNLDKMAHIDLPLLVIHGERDSLIPVANGQALYDASPSRQKTIKRVIGAGHNDLLFYADEYFAAIEDFLVTTR